MLHYCIILIAGACTHALLFYVFGIRDEFVDSLRYIEMADYLLSNSHFQFFYQIFYAIPVALLAVFTLVFENGITAFIAFQSLLSLVAAFALYHATSRLFKDDVSGLVAALCYFLWFDCLQWNTALMTESLASTITCFTLCHLVRFRCTVKDGTDRTVVVQHSDKTDGSGPCVSGNCIFSHPLLRTTAKECP